MRIAMVSLVYLACGDNLAPPPVEVGDGTESSLRALVYSQPAQIEILRGEEVVWSTRAGGGLSDKGEPHGFAGVRTASADVQMLFGSFKFEPDEGEPSHGVDALGDVVAARGPCGSRNSAMAARQGAGAEDILKNARGRS